MFSDLISREEIANSGCLEKMKIGLSGCGVLCGFDCMVRLVADAIRMAEGGSTRKEWQQRFYKELKEELKYDTEYY